MLILMSPLLTSPLYIMFFKKFHELIDLDVHEFFVISNYNTRGHNFKIKRFSVNNNDNEFSNRSVNIWNSLPDAVVNCKTLSLFKYKLKAVTLKNIVLVYNSLISIL